MCDRLSSYKVSGVLQGERVDRAAREGERPLPERTIGVTALRAERGVHDDEVGLPPGARDIAYLERRREPEVPGSPFREPHRLLVRVDPSDRSRSEGRGAEGEPTGSAAQVEDGPTRESVQALGGLEKRRRGLRRARDLLAAGVGAREVGNLLKEPDELRVLHERRTTAERFRPTVRGSPDLAPGKTSRGVRGAGFEPANALRDRISSAVTAV